MELGGFSCNLAIISRVAAAGAMSRRQQPDNLMDFFNVHKEFKKVYLPVSSSSSLTRHLSSLSKICV